MKKISAGGLRAVNEEGAAVRIAEAGFPAPFAQVLEFNAPVHETWNIVHIGYNRFICTFKKARIFYQYHSVI